VLLTTYSKSEYETGPQLKEPSAIVTIKIILKTIDEVQVGLSCKDNTSPVRVVKNINQKLTR
jgi:hypothetical protein